MRQSAHNLSKQFEYTLPTVPIVQDNRFHHLHASEIVEYRSTVAVFSAFLFALPKPAEK